MTQNIITTSGNEKVKGQGAYSEGCVTKFSTNLYLDNVMENENYIICIKLEETVSKLNFKELQLTIAIYMNLLYLLTLGQK